MSLFTKFAATATLRKGLAPVRRLPTPGNLSAMWNMGSLLGLILVAQLLTGIFLAMHYVPTTAEAFDSVVHITRDVKHGWWLRALHSNGAGMFFFFLYLHLGRGLYFGSYRHTLVWLTGCALFLLLMLTAFLGYVLVWGQMSYWAATVITSLLSAIPYVGKTVLEWLWGGYAVDDATLRRFFVLHFLLPLVIAALSMAHMALLHKEGSSNPLGISSDVSRVSFHPYYTWKDALGGLVCFLGLGVIAFFFPYAFLAPENFIPANPLVTPDQIMPEWYFLWAYAILRSIPSKLGGLVILLATIVWLLALPLIANQLHAGAEPATQWQQKAWLFWVLTALFMALTYLGGCPAQAPYALITYLLVCVLFFVMFAFALATQPTGLCFLGALTVLLVSSGFLVGLAHLYLG